MTTNNIHFSKEDISFIENALLSHRRNLYDNDQDKCSEILKKFPAKHNGATISFIEETSPVEVNPFDSQFFNTDTRNQLLSMFNYFKSNMHNKPNNLNLSSATVRKCLFLASALLNHEVFGSLPESGFGKIQPDDSLKLATSIKEHLNSIYDFTALQSEENLNNQDIAFYRVAFFFHNYCETTFNNICDDRKHSPLYAVSVMKNLNSKEDWETLLDTSIDETNESHYVYNNFDLFSIKDSQQKESILSIPLFGFLGDIGEYKLNLIRIY